MLTPPKAWYSSEDDDFSSNISGGLGQLLDTPLSSPVGKNDSLNSLPKVGGRYAAIPANCLIDEYFINSLSGGSSSPFGLTPRPLVPRPPNDFQRIGRDQIFLPNTNQGQTENQDMRFQQEKMSDLFDPFLNEHLIEDVEGMPESSPLKTRNEAAKVPPDVDPFLSFADAGAVVDDVNTAETPVSPDAAQLDMNDNHYAAERRAFGSSSGGFIMRTAYGGGENQQSDPVPSVTPEKERGEKFVSSDPDSSTNKVVRITAKDPCTIPRQLAFSARAKTIVAAKTSPKGIPKTKSPLASFTLEGHPSAVHTGLGAIRSSGCDPAGNKGGDCAQKKGLCQPELPRASFTAQGCASTINIEVGVLTRKSGCDVIETEGNESVPGSAYDRLHCLRAIRFVFEIHRDVWEDRYQEMIQFRIRNGHTNVPTDYKNKKLATWVKCQRRQYKLWITSKPSSITKERIEKLESIGFQWKANSYQQKTSAV